MVNWHSLKKEEMFRELKTSEKGLTEKEAQKRLEKYGENIIKKSNKLDFFKIFFEQFKSFLIYILIIAAVVSFLISNYLDGIIISIIILVNALIGFFQ